MRRLVQFYFFMVCFVGGTGRLYAQPADTPTHLIRIYEDDDFINIWGQGTDNAYTNGTRLDYFYDLPKPSHSLINRFLPRAGSESINTYGWGIVQLMYTPDDLTKSDYQPHDYPYSGSLYASHMLYSYNPVRHYSFQTELVLGVIGPAALAKETQTLVHRWEGYDLPKGWNHQFNTDVLANINLNFEKQIAAAGRGLEIIGGGQITAGTMQNSLSLYPLIRFGNMRPYFDGFISQYTGIGKNDKGHHKGQFYFFVKPAAQLVLTNAMVQGGVFTKNPNLQNDGGGSKPVDPVTGQVMPTSLQDSLAQIPYPNVNRLEASLTYGVVFTSGNFSISGSQITSSAQLKGLYCHQTGNISLYFSW